MNNVPVASPQHFAVIKTKVIVTEAWVSSLVCCKVHQPSHVDSVLESAGKVWVLSLVHFVAVVTQQPWHCGEHSGNVHAAAKTQLCVHWVMPTTVHSNGTAL